MASGSGAAKRGAASVPPSIPPLSKDAGLATKDRTFLSKGLKTVFAYEGFLPMNSHLTVDELKGLGWVDKSEVWDPANPLFRGQVGTLRHLETGWTDAFKEFVGSKKLEVRMLLGFEILTLLDEDRRRTPQRIPSSLSKTQSEIGSNMAKCFQGTMSASSERCSLVKGVAQTADIKTGSINPGTGESIRESKTLVYNFAVPDADIVFPGEKPVFHAFAPAGGDEAAYHAKLSQDYGNAGCHILAWWWNYRKENPSVEIGTNADKAALSVRLLERVEGYLCASLCLSNQLTEAHSISSLYLFLN